MPRLICAKRPGGHSVSGWSTVAVLLLAFVAGWFVRDWQAQRDGRLDAEQRVTVAEAQPAKQVADERRLTAATDTRERGKALARAGVERAPALADCPVPDELASLLVTQLQATRSNAGKVPDRPVP